MCCLFSIFTEYITFLGTGTFLKNNEYIIAHLKKRQFIHFRPFVFSTVCRANIVIKWSIAECPLFKFAYVSFPWINQNPFDGGEGSCRLTKSRSCPGDGGHLCAEPKICCSYPFQGGWPFLSNITTSQQYGIKVTKISTERVIQQKKVSNILQ